MPLARSIARRRQAAQESACTRRRKGALLPHLVRLCRVAEGGPRGQAAETMSGGAGHNGF